MWKRELRRVTYAALYGVVGALIALPAAGVARAQPPLIVGMDHIPIVVSDLEIAVADFHRMGFAIKPGRPHSDGIRNAHVKFPDGTELELITAPQSADALTSEYRAKLATGEGAVYFGLYAPDHTSLLTKLKELGTSVRQDGGLLTFPAADPLHPLFFALGEKSPTDRPEHFAHSNTGIRLSGLWVRRIPQLLSLMRNLGFAPRKISPCGPIKGEVQAVRLPEGNLYLVRNWPANVAAARIEVRSLATAQDVLRKNGLTPLSYPACDRPAIWLPPRAAHGVWLQFVQAETK